uniref:Uncharacterized protein n=1 Tax=Rhizophora mucronata TaxID=61149 RepID=A0A2P2NQ28_RHIMU
MVAINCVLSFTLSSKIKGSLNVG